METGVQWDPRRLAIAATVSSEPVVSLDFHRNGHFLAMATKDSVHLVDSLAGVEKKRIQLKTNGVGLVRFTHHESCVLVTSDRKNNDIRYVSVLDNKYLRFFRGHDAAVVSLAMSPVNDFFLSASKDGVILQWNLAQPKPVKRLELPADSANIRVHYDPNGGQVFAVMCRDLKKNVQTLKLYGADTCETGPFLDVAPSETLVRAAISRAHPPVSAALTDKYVAAMWTEFEFAPDGKSLLVNTNADLLLVLDAFAREKEPLAICSRKNENGIPNLGMCFSADGKYVVAANDDKELLVYDVRSGSTVTILTGHLQMVKNVRCNPRYDVMASSCTSLALWIAPS